MTTQVLKIKCAALLAIIPLLCSCNSGGSAQNESAATTVAQQAAPAYDRSLPRGEVKDSMECRVQPKQYYALYLPNNYSPDKASPCMVFFDSHARGALPLIKYKELAERYGFVFVGSDFSKNGTPWPVTQEAVTALLADVKSRINVDPKRLYVSGFSGGSRVASSVAAVIGGVAGVIGCGAGFSSEDAPKNRFDYFGMAGTSDFNISEMEQLDAALQQIGFAHQLLTFDGKHAWPGVAEMNTALLWMQVNAIKEQTQPKNDSLVLQLKHDFDRRIEAAHKDPVTELSLVDGVARELDGLTDVSNYKSRAAELTAQPAYKEQASRAARLQQQEMEMQQELAHQFTQMNESWWTTKIGELRHSAQSAKTLEEKQMYQRVLNYLGLVGYMNSNHALNSDDLSHAETYVKVFRMADPQNPDASYLAAVYYIKKGDKDKAIAMLQEAAAHGYSEVALVAANPAFTALQNTDAYTKVIEKIKANNKTE